MAKLVHLVTDLPRGACVERLREATDGPFVAFGKKPVVASVSEDKATLRKRLKGRNSFQTALRARFVDIPTGTRLDCRTGMHPAVVVFMGLWLSAVAVIGGMVFIASLIALTGAAESEIPPAIGLAAPPAFLLFGALMLLGGRALARGEEAFLVEFVSQTLNARPVSGGAPVGTVS